MEHRWTPGRRLILVAALWRGRVKATELQQRFSVTAAQLRRWRREFRHILKGRFTRRSALSSPLFHSWIAIAIAVSAAVIAVWQGETSREHNRQSVRPLLDLVRSTNAAGDLCCGLTLRNIGLGPAKIELFELRFGDFVISTRNLDEFSNEQLMELARQIFASAEFVPGAPALEEGYNFFVQYSTIFRRSNIPEGDEVAVLVFDESLFNYFPPYIWSRVFHEVQILVEYSSIYGERFVYCRATICPIPPDQTETDLTLLVP